MADPEEKTEPKSENKSAAEDFARAADEGQMGLLAEFWDFLLHNKKWWITPVIVMLLLAGLMVFLSTTSLAPFIYTIF